MTFWLRRKQLPLWIWLLDLCERHGWTKARIYYWFARRVIRCNRLRLTP